MAFSTKLTDTIETAAGIAKADDASMFTFLIKNRGEALSYVTNMGAPELFCAVAALMVELEERTELPRKKIYKILEETLKEAPLTKTDGDDE